MKNKNENKNKDVNNSELEVMCKHISQRELNAQKAERQSIKYMQCVYLSDFIGKVYKGLVSSIMEFGIFVTIQENDCTGVIKLTDIGGDTFIADVENYRVKGHNTGSYIRLGDEVMVVVKSVDIEKKNINLTLLRL